MLKDKDKGMDGVKELDEELAGVAGGAVFEDKTYCGKKGGFMGTGGKNQYMQLYRVFNDTTHKQDSCWRSKEEADRKDREINKK